MFSVAVFVASAAFLFGTALSAPYGSSYSDGGTVGGNTTTSSSPVYNTTADISVLQYALTLENLEAAFYVGALTKFSQADFIAAGLTARDYQIISAVRDHEVTHVASLSAAIRGLGATPVPACTYNFPQTDVKSFLGIARALEKTGVSAYDGAAKDISNPAYLTVAASIVTVEARHAAFFNYITGKTPAPQPFDIPLGQRQIVSIAAPFITSCPYTLPMTFPALTISPASGAAGISLTLTTTANLNGAKCAFITGSGTNFLVPVASGACAVPATLAGDVYVVLTSAGAIGDLNDANTLAGPASFTVPDKADTA